MTRSSTPSRAWLALCALTAAFFALRCGGATCPTGQKDCKGVCATVATDPANCGACGTACPAGQVCSSGACAVACGGGTTKCGEVCADTRDDPKNCGACGTMCAAGEVCSQSACGVACGGGTTKCGTKCVDTAVDAANCSACGMACMAGQFCSGSKCTSSCAGMVCGTQCVDTSTSNANCGGCGMPCGASQVCAGAKCGCPIGQTDCGGVCVNLSDNSLNCGSCGGKCDIDQVCGGGLCATPADGNGQAGGGLSGMSPLKVAVMIASSSTDLADKLTATATFSKVDAVDVASTAPTVAEMKAYDAVAVYTYVSPAAGFGDNLATYFEAGGGVVLFDYESQESDLGYGLTGQFETKYALSTPVPNATYLTAAVTLGTLLEPASPILAGVTKFGYPDTGGSAYHLPMSAFTLNSPIVVAQFSDGSPAVVRGVVNGRNLVEINGFGASNPAYSSGWDDTTDGAKLIANALKYTVPPPQVTVPAKVSFGKQALLMGTAPQAITYTNVSTTPQIITALSVSGTHIGEFVATPAMALPATIAPAGTFTVNVVFTPIGVGLRAATLHATVMGAPGQATTLMSGTGM